MMEIEKMPSIVHFEIPVDEPQRARDFYSGLFGWKIESFPGMDYMMIDTLAPAEG